MAGWARSSLNFEAVSSRTKLHPVRRSRAGAPGTCPGQPIFLGTRHDTLGCPDAPKSSSGGRTRLRLVRDVGVTSTQKTWAGRN